MVSGVFFKREKDFQDKYGIQKFHYQKIFIEDENKERQYPIVVFFDDERILFEYSAIHKKDDTEELFRKQLFSLPLVSKSTNRMVLTTLRDKTLIF